MNKYIVVEDGLSINLNRGVGQYTLSIIKMLKNLGYTIDVPRKTFLDNIKITLLRRIFYILWLNTIFVFNLFIRKDINCVIFPATITPFIRPKNIEYISVMHDVLHLVYPETRTFIQRMHDYFAFWTASKFANKIITVSKTTKQELINRKIITKQPIYVVYNTHSVSLIESENESKNILENLNIKEKKYILSVATVHRHKNIQTLINAFESISEKYKDIKLVLVGNKGNCSLNITKPNIILSGFVSNGDLKILYQNALFYVFPSLYEGFGIPLIDAQYFGLPVLCSDIPIFREVCQDTAEYFISEKESLVIGLNKLLNSDSVRNILITLGKKNTNRFLIVEISKQLQQCLEG